MLNWIKTIAGYVVPGVGPALKWGPWVLCGLLAVVVLVQHNEIAAAQANTLAAQAETGKAVAQCQAEASTEAAKESAASVAQMQAAQAAAASAEKQLSALRQAAASTQAGAAQAAAKAQADIDAQAARPGQDGAIPPVLAEQFQ